MTEDKSAAMARDLAERLFVGMISSERYIHDFFTPREVPDGCSLVEISISFANSFYDYYTPRAAEHNTLRAALKRSAFDISPCSRCGEDVVCLPDGLPLCVDCHGRKKSNETYT